MAQEWADSPRNSKERPQTRNSQDALDGQARPSISSSKGVRGNTSFDLLNESSPLLSPQDPESQDGHTSPRPSHPSTMLDCGDDDEEESKSVWYLFLLTLSIGGLQIAWTVEISNGSPYLLSLGMSKSLLALVWIAGPLSGTLVQPYVGIMSDNCRVSWGKRKPYMLAGAAATLISLVALAWAREIVSGVLGIFGADAASYGVKLTAITFAIAVVYILDCAINTVQAGIRAFIVDNAPTHQQEDANAWAGRISGVGNILGYLSGYVDLPVLTGGYFGNTQFKVLCVIACFALGGTVVISCLYIREHDPRLEGPPSDEKLGVISFFRQVFSSIQRLNPQVRKVCDAQFFTWMGWFPFLFYITTYIGQLHLNPYFASNPDLSEAEIDTAWEKGTRVATFALLIFAITSFICNLILPFIVVPSYNPPTNLSRNQSFHSARSPYRHGQPTTPGTPGAMSASMTSFFPPTPSPSSHSRLTRLLSAAQIPWLTLRRAWFLSHILFAICMFLTFFIRTTTGATVLVGIVGLSWALTLWAPFALISAEISKRDAAARKLGGGAAKEDKAGIVLGLHNVAVSAPQILATLVSSAIFKVTQKPRGSAGDDSVGWVLRFGGLAALVAAYMTSRIGEEAEKKKERKGEADEEMGEGS
ncbi:MAG: hypothetical protein Q9195_001130 [Heterodermia aff. obscurata]